MSPFNPRMLWVGLVMLAGAGLALAMTPTQKIADRHGRTDLEAMIPHALGDWKVDPSVVPIEPNPEVQALLDSIYSQTLSRTYVNSAGKRVMLSIAYGGNQTGMLQVHRPEVCYTGNGFQIVRAALGELATRYGALPVKRLFAVMGPRTEPITYWVTVGDEATAVGFRQKLAQLRYGLTGKVPDGFLVRVSTIDRDEQGAFRLQAEFIDILLGAMSEPDRARVAGRFGA